MIGSEGELVAILEALRPHAVLVGSASRCGAYRDLDFVVSAKGFEVARKMFPEKESPFIGAWSTCATAVPLEAFRYWYGPDYPSLVRRKRELIDVEVHGVVFRAWPVYTE